MVWAKGEELRHVTLEVALEVLGKRKDEIECDVQAGGAGEVHGADDVGRCMVTFEQTQFFLAERLAAEGTYEQEFLDADRLLTAAGFEHYEVSNYARPGARAVHNAAYWRRVPYIGLGPSAHGFDGVERRWNLREYAAWREAAAQGADPVGGTERLVGSQEALERIYLGLRGLSGVEIVDADRPLLERWRDAGWVALHDHRARLTPSGWLRLDALASALTDIRSR